MDRVNRLRGLLCSCVLSAFVAFAPAAMAQGKADAVRPEVGKPLQAAQGLVKQRKGREALAEVAKAEAVPNRTPYENFLIQQMRGSAAAAAGDSAGIRWRFFSAHCRMKCWASSSISAGRSRSAGTKIVNALIRKNRSERNPPPRTSASRSRWVAHTTRTSTSISSVPPTRVIRRCSSTRSSLAWSAAVISPISSRNSVPPWAASK